MTEQKGVTPREYVENILAEIANGTIPPERHDPQRQTPKMVLVAAGEYTQTKAENARLLKRLETAEAVTTAARVAAGYITNALVRAILMDALAAYDAGEGGNA
jgi:hypothetical protein